MLIVTVNTVTVNSDLKSRLLAAIRDVTGVPTLAYARTPEPLTGGFWAELVAFSLVDPPPGWPLDLVARIMPDPGSAQKETIVQAAVSAAGFPTPAVRAAGGQESALGRAFMIMDLASGTSLLPSLSGAAAVSAGLRLARTLPETLASTMAHLHALDPGPVRAELSLANVSAATVPDLLGVLGDMAAGYERADLADAARWLITNLLAPAPEVICHGDLHPFNLLVNGRDVTVLDWSTTLVAPRAYDVAFTALILSEPPIRVSGPGRRLVRRMGHHLANRFVRRYQANARATVGAAELGWYQAVVCLRSLTEVAGWAARDEVAERAGHPWLVSGNEIASHLSAVTGIPVRPR
jgi:aminoglycoside phosphotransferase (APT) family kinase protein